MSKCLSLATAHSLSGFIYLSQTNLGICKLKEKAFEDAFDLFKSAMEQCNTSFERTKGLYHIGVCHMQNGKTDECDAALKEALAFCSTSVEELAEERRKEEERIRKEEEEKNMMDDGTGNMISLKPKQQEEGSVVSEQNSLVTQDSLATIPTNMPVAFGTQEGAILHSQILNLLALNQMRREESGFNDPNIEAALDSVTHSLTLSSRLYSPLAKALTLNNFAIISAINGDNDNAKKYHGQNLRIIDDDKSYKVRQAKRRAKRQTKKRAVGRFALIAF